MIRSKLVKRVSYINKSWYKNGIRYVNDLLDQKGGFLSIEDLQTKYNVNKNFVQYNGIKQAIQKSFSHLLKNSNTTHKNPLQGFNVRCILKEAKGCKYFYSLFIDNKQVFFKCVNKWNLILNSNIDNNEWFYVCHYNWRSTYDVKLRWFQFRLLNRILCTNTLLVKIGKSNNTKCTFCETSEESIDHLFWDCTYSRKYWDYVQKWVNNCLNTNITLKKETVLLGNHQFPDYVLNNILLLLKFDIYKSRLKNEKPTAVLVKKIVNNYYDQEKFLYQTRMHQRAFENRWQMWKSILE